MKTLLVFLFVLLTLATGLSIAAHAQTAPTSGRIQYEVAQKVDLSQARVVINGQVVKPGSPDFPTDIPDTRTFGMTLSFAGNYAKEERENNAMRVVQSDGPNSAPQTTSLGRPYDEAVYIDQQARAVATVVALKTDGTTTTYRTDAPFVKPTGWQETTQTKKIAGFTCRKATVPYQKETYTVWYTTELPFTYSPVKELMPEKGVVLALEGSREQFRATKVDTKPVAEADVRPNAGAQLVSTEQLRDLRDKARADFRQRMMDRAIGN
ncbi:GLPGLI family protein [Hymenobacter busanensis]|uniref:GLPGLI family protein n=1 Tax=Hymenobacter busanensis TaxID=2607656 RepID=A0A7L4ZT80_9BACT|nr:GLPGLI family protein [Hymenobacter busanensis]KAA9327674.1 GLPGLI family protein [Hymenobacter busanensis]QHJ05986.1 GLPGLI family protein [Hymenobacter busanensis]